MQFVSISVKCGLSKDGLVVSLVPIITKVPTKEGSGLNVGLGSANLAGQSCLPCQLL